MGSKEDIKRRKHLACEAFLVHCRTVEFNFKKGLISTNILKPNRPLKTKRIKHPIFIEDETQFHGL